MPEIQQLAWFPGFSGSSVPSDAIELEDTSGVWEFEDGSIIEWG